MIVWQGKGIFVLLIFIAACIAAVPSTLFWIVPNIGLARDDDRGVYLAIAVAAFVSMIATYPLGAFGARPTSDQIPIDKGGTNVLRSGDTLCFIDIRYWPFLFLALTLAMLAITFV
jgi:hypothetical protein